MTFLYDKHTDEHIGVWLTRGNADVEYLIKISRLKRFHDTIERIVVSEFDEKSNSVWLEVWCKSLLDSILGKNRYNVFHIMTEVNKNWICEGNIGNGVNFFDDEK